MICEITPLAVPATNNALDSLWLMPAVVNKQINVYILAAQRCFRDWVRERGGFGSSEVADAKQLIEEAIQIGGSANF